MVDLSTSEEERMADTGVRDPHYNLVSVLYHTLQEADLLDRYIQDAEQAGDQELAGYFREVQQSDRDRAVRAKDFLKQRLG